MKKRWIRLLTAAWMLACGQQILAEDAVPTGQLPREVVPTHYQLEMKVDPEQTAFSGYAAIDIVVKKPTQSFYINGQELKITDTQIVGSQGTTPAKTHLTAVDGVLKVTATEKLKPGDYTVKFTYEAPFNENLQGLYRVKDGDKHYAFTQMESIYARYAFPSFDEPGFKVPFDLDLIIPKNLTAIANTPEKSVQDLGNGWKKIAFIETKPLPTYLWAIAVGDFDVVEWQPLPPTKVRQSPLPLRGIATKGKGKQLSYALQHTQEIVEALEDYFQIAYPYRKLDILAVPDFAAGAMENAGAITYREQLLLLDEKASIGQKRSYKSVHAHELAHQWFGNLVTPKWWDDIWLNEAFATWMAATALDRKWPDEQWKRDQNRGSKYAMNADSIPSARKVRNPIESNSDIITAFDGITYSKGGGVLAMIESFMGPENFRKGVQKYMYQYAWKNTDALQFFEAIASVLEPERAKEVVKSFRDFVEKAGVPLLTIKQSCKDERTVLDIQQERYAPLGTQFKEETIWNIPACFSYEVDGEIKQQCEVLAKRSQKVKMNIAGCADWVMPNVGAAGYYRFNYDANGWKAMLGNLNKVSPVEANAVLDSMKAAYSSGNLKVKDLMAVIPSTVDADSWEVKTSGMSTLGSLISYAEESEKPVLRKLAGDIYRAKADELGLTDNTAMDKTNPLETSRLRSSYIGFMAMTAKDKAYRKTLTELAKSYIGFGGDNQLHDDVMIPSLRTLAMSVAVQEIGQPFVDALMKLYRASTDGTLRGRLLSAMTATKEPAIAKQLIALSLSDEVRDNEKSTLLFGLAGTKELDSVIWPWLKANFDELVKKLPTNYQAFTPYLFMGDCVPEKAERLDEFLKPRLKGLTGADRNYVKAKEYLSQCLAFKAHVKPEITELVKSMH